MKLTLTQTTETGDLNGVACRVWEGQTEKGVKVVAFVALIAVSGEAHDAFERDLLGEAVPASPQVVQVLAALTHASLRPDPDPVDNAGAWPTRES